jgi:alkylation response protein AidB-like acyl-CoA dehydrogenase
MRFVLEKAARLDIAGLSGHEAACRRTASRSRSDFHLGKLVSGEWTGTMNLTAPQAGSDLGALRTRAVRAGDHYHQLWRPRPGAKHQSFSLYRS